jgi:hypothetical protein
MKTIKRQGIWATMTAFMLPALVACAVTGMSEVVLAQVNSGGNAPAAAAPRGDAPLNLKTIKTRAEGAVLFAEINSPHTNMIGPELVADLVSLIEVLDRGDTYRVVVFSSADPDFFIPHVDVTKIAAYRQEAAKLCRSLCRIAIRFTFGAFVTARW